MATGSSEDSYSAPRIFHVYHQEDTNSFCSSDSPIAHKCPLCKKFKKYFYCKDCVQSGHITNKVGESYTKLRKVLTELQATKKNVEWDCAKQLDVNQKCDVMQSKIRHIKERNRLIRLAVEEKRQKRTYYNQRLIELRDRNLERREKLKAYKKKSEAYEDWVCQKYDNVTIARDRLANKHEEIKKLAKLRVQQLFKYVFPISVVKPETASQPSFEMESSEDSTTRELAEACEMNLIKDRWVCTDYSNEMQYSVVAPCLPSNGNYTYYTNYGLWARNKDGIPTSEESEFKEINPTFSISAALTYTAQLVNILSFFLNVRLPYKMVYSEFSSVDIDEQQFTRRVARLNANILYLCISQNMDLNVLIPNGTIHNILQLRDSNSADLGRQGPVEVNDIQVTALEKSLLNDLKSGGDDSDSEGDSFTVEWEAVPHVQCPEASPGPATVQSTVINTQVSSMAGGLVNSAVASVASIWRGFTGR